MQQKVMLIEIKHFFLLSFEKKSSILKTGLYESSGGARNQPEGPVSTTLTHMTAVKRRTGGGQQRAHVIRRKWQSFSQHV